MIYPAIVVRYIGTTRTKLLVMPLCRLNMNARIQCGFIAQLAEHKTENLGVVSSILTEATI